MPTVIPDKKTLITVFEDTENMCKQNAKLRETINYSINNTHFYAEDDTPKLPKRRFDGTKISVVKYRSLETAMFYKQKYTQDKICVHNFASATNPGGGVRHGSRAQEEAICRCSTLYPVLNTEKNQQYYYGLHRERRDAIYTDATLYTPNIFIIKSDTNIPQLLPESKWIEIDVLTCAAPNLREYPSNVMNPDSGEQVHLTKSELLALHEQRGRHICAIAAKNNVDILILGAFGCGAFCNDPQVVAEAYKHILPKFDGMFREVCFAIYSTPREKRNYEAFKIALDF